MKDTLSLFGFIGACLLPVVGIVGINETGHQTCSIHYDTSFNGLYLIKERVCVGRLGMETERKEVGRKELFERF